MNTSSSVTAASVHHLSSGDPERVQAVSASGMLGRSCAELDAITDEARIIMGTEVAAITVVTERELHIVSGSGIEPHVMPREQSVCTHVVASAEPLMVTDMLRDPFFASHPLVGDKDALRSYCGVPITTAEGHVAGALCVLDSRERRFSPAQLTALGMLAQRARQVLVPGAPDPETLPAAQWLREDPLAAWIEQVIPTEHELDALLARRRRSGLGRVLRRAA